MNLILLLSSNHHGFFLEENTFIDILTCLFICPSALLHQSANNDLPIISLLFKLILSKDIEWSSSVSLQSSSYS